MNFLHTDCEGVLGKLLVLGHYTAKLGCHTKGQRRDDMDRHVSSKYIEAACLYYMVYKCKKDHLTISANH